MRTQKELGKKRASGCSSVGCSSHDTLSNCKRNCVPKSVHTKQKVANVNEKDLGSGDMAKTIFRTRFIYNSSVKPKEVDAALVAKVKNNPAHSRRRFEVVPRTFRASTRTTSHKDSVVCRNRSINDGNTINKSDIVSADSKGPGVHVSSVIDSSIGVTQVGLASRPSSVNATKSIEPVSTHEHNQTCLLYDTRVNGIDDKFINSIFHHEGRTCAPHQVDSRIFQQWQEQSEFAFGFVPHSEQVMPDVIDIASPVGLSAFEIHALVRATGKYN